MLSFFNCCKMFMFNLKAYLPLIVLLLFLIALLIYFILKSKKIMHNKYAFFIFFTYNF